MMAQIGRTRQAIWLEIKETMGYILIILFTFICRGVEHLFVPISVIYAIKKKIVEPILKTR